MADPLLSLRHWTQARILLGRCGTSLPTQRLLELKLARARARDAVHAKWNPYLTQAGLKPLETPSLLVHSKVRSRSEYLKRPDLGRHLHEESREALSAIGLSPAATDIAVVVSDGLSSSSVTTHFIPLWAHLKETLFAAGLSCSPMILAPFSRVAIGDEIGFLLQCRMTLVIMGERPGLTMKDSLGIYLTYDPRPGRTDSERNYISNICPPEGLSYLNAASRVQFLIQQSLKRRLSGVHLKEESRLIL